MYDDENDNDFVGKLFAILTFPGIILHELSHYIACKICKIKVIETELFTLKYSDCIGYVIHDTINSEIKSFIVGISPSIFGTIISFVIFKYMNISNNDTITLFLFWLGMSIIINSFPSKTDINNSYTTIKINWKNHKYGFKTILLIIINVPIICILIPYYIISELDNIGINIMYGIIIMSISGGTIN